MIEYNALVRDAAQKANVPRAEYQGYIDIYFSEVLERLKAGSDICIHDTIGKIVLREHAGKPVYGGGLTKQRFTPIFKSSNTLKKALVQSEEEYISALRRRGKDKIADNLLREENNL